MKRSHKKLGFLGRDWTITFQGLVGVLEKDVNIVRSCSFDQALLPMILIGLSFSIPHRIYRYCTCYSFTG